MYWGNHTLPPSYFVSGGPFSARTPSRSALVRLHGADSVACSTAARLACHHQRASACVCPSRTQETEAYLLMCRVWVVTLDAIYLLYNYWKVNLKDADIAFATGENASGVHDFFS